MRKLTVSTLRRQFGAMYRNNFAETCVPSIRMSGDWLAKAGFTPGDRVDVEIDFTPPTTGLIIIRKENR